MYILLPLGILVIALAGIVYIIGRKFVYLKKLTPEAINNPPATAKAFWSGLFPEVVAFFGEINWREYRVKLTAEFEKLIRRLRLVFLKIEGATATLANRLRRSKKYHEEILHEEMVEEAIVPIISPTVDPMEEEQHLIMEIAKSPKDPLLYLKLGDVYLKTDDKENARMSFKTVLDLDPENWYAKKKLADLAQR